MFCSLARCSSNSSSGVEKAPPFSPNMWDLGRELVGGFLKNRNENDKEKRTIIG